MSDIRIDGAWYCDATPDGAFAIVVAGRHIATHRGSKPLPRIDGLPQNVLYLRLARDGVRYAGQIHEGRLKDHVFEWDGSEWHDRGEVTSVSPCIYDNADVLRLNDGLWGGQGARFVAPDNTIITADQTYFAPQMELSEWTALSPDCCIGQSHPDGTNDAAWIWDAGTRRLLEPGPCRFIRAHRNGDRVSIAIWKPGQGAVIHWLTLAEIHALPVVTLPGPPPPPPDPEPPMSELETVRRIRAKYPLSNPGGFPLGDDGWMPLVEIAQAFQAQVFRKDNGERVKIPSLGKSCNRTIIGRGPILGTRWVKVFADGEGTAAPIWSVGDTPADGEYIDVSGVVIPGSAPPPPPPPPPPSGDLESRVTRLETFMFGVKRA